MPPTYGLHRSTQAASAAGGLKKVTEVTSSVSLSRTMTARLCEIALCPLVDADSLRGSRMGKSIKDSRRDSRTARERRRLPLHWSLRWIPPLDSRELNEKDTEHYAVVVVYRRSTMYEVRFCEKILRKNLFIHESSSWASHRGAAWERFVSACF